MIKTPLYSFSKKRRIVTYEVMKMKDLQGDMSQRLSRETRHCRMCKSADLAVYLDLGHTPPADQFRTEEELSLPEVTYPLRVMLCKTCGLSQLNHVVDPRILYQYNYPYESSITATGKKHWDSFTQAVCRRLALKHDSFVVDVGSNVGTLLKSFKDQGMRVVGIDSAPNIVAIANENDIKTYGGFYPSNIAHKILKKHGKASVIIGTNVFAHIDDLEEVLTASNVLLTPDGVFIFESPHFGMLIENLAYDTIYHEHLSYLSLTPVVRFVKRFDMEVFAVEESDIHGGSFRVYIGKKGKRSVDANVRQMIAREKKQKLHDLNTLKKFSKRVEQSRHELMSLIEKLLHRGKKIVAVSAPAKGMTLLNYCGLTNRHIAFVTEKARLKIGRYTPGGHIPIVPDEALLTEKPDYALLLAWNFAEEIIHNNEEYKKRGGKFIIPIPSPKIL